MVTFWEMIDKQSQQRQGRVGVSPYCLLHDRLTEGCAIASSLLLGGDKVVMSWSCRVWAI